MYEAEVNSSTESIETLPAEIRKRFAEFRDEITARTVLPWGEHCTECVWPTCYTTCELYTPRTDGACRQFVDGMVRIDHSDGLSQYLLKLRFKAWAKLWTVGNLHLQPLSKAATQERLNMAVGAIGRNAPLPASVKPRLLRKISYVRRRAAEDARVTGTPDCFLLECYNPNAGKITLTLTVRNALAQAQPFQTLISAPPGYTRARVGFSRIAQSIDISRSFELEIVPNGSDDTVLYFGLMDFVSERDGARKDREPATETTKWKCIAWDLDNTLWDGVLVEDGPENIRLRQGVVDVIKQLDERGILQSIVSKNSHDDAMKVLRAAGIDEFFLYPQIAWRPKSESIAQIAKLLNIGLDTLAFVDDQVFEREEVRGAFPQVTAIDAADYVDISLRPECDVPVTPESTRRRSMYREQEQRQAALDSHEGRYLDFLRNCQLTMRMRPLDEANLKRVYELAQRTNQMNFSGNRYAEAQLAEIMRTPFLETCVIDCSDRFGQYGIVGFAVIDVREPRLLDLMFSCRIQGKRVEHAVLSHLLKRFADVKKGDFYANYRRTPKNAPSGKVFDEMGFEPVADETGGSLVFRDGREIPDDQIVTIERLASAERDFAGTRSVDAL